MPKKVASRNNNCFQGRVKQGTSRQPLMGKGSGYIVKVKVNVRTPPGVLSPGASPISEQKSGFIAIREPGAAAQLQDQNSFCSMNVYSLETRPSRSSRKSVPV